MVFEEILVLELPWQFNGFLPASQPPVSQQASHPGSQQPASQPPSQPAPREKQRKKNIIKKTIEVKFPPALVPRSSGAACANAHKPYFPSDRW